MSFVLPTLRPDQQVVKDFILTRPFCGVFLGIGGGKTLTTLSALADARPAGHILVIAPLSIARSVWLDEIEKWGFPVRTKSLIVDEEDRKLTTAARLELFAEVMSEPPTMYFINQEMLTRPTKRENHILPAAQPSAKPVPEGAEPILEQIRSGSFTADQLVAEHRVRTAATDGKPLAKAKAEALVRALVKSGHAERVALDCPVCSGRGCRACMHGLIDQMPRVKNGRKEQILWPFSTVVIDESQGFKSAQSSRFKALMKVRPAMTRLIELTGTPSPNSLLDLWAQIQLIDQGTTFGRFTQYRSRYFEPTVHIDGRPVKWELIPGSEKAIHAAVAPYVMSTKNTSIPRPPASIDIADVVLPKHVMSAYKDFAKEQVLELAGPDPKDPSRTVITADNAAILHGKLIQFASGTIYTGEGSTYAVVHTEKLAMTEHLVANADSNALVAYRYISEREQLAKHLREAGHDVHVFDGSRAQIKAWNDKQIPILLVHPASAGPGLNLQHGGSTLIWHTLPESLGDYEQLNGRLIRPGQPDPVQVWCLVSKGTLDARQPGKLRIKAAMQQGLIDAVERPVGSVSAADPFRALMEDFGEILGDFDIHPY